MSKPKKWHEVYPYGTKAGDEEAKVFRALSRHAKFDWRSTGAIVKATGLTRERVEEIIDKYVNKVSPPLIYAHSSNEDHWGYWERCPDVLKKDERDIAKKDKDSRVDKQITSASMVGGMDLAMPSKDKTAMYEQYFADADKMIAEFRTTGVSDKLSAEIVEQGCWSSLAFPYGTEDDHNIECWSHIAELETVGEDEPMSYEKWRKLTAA